jgi:hypothetical protein
MSAETKQQLLEKLEQSRRLLQQASDQTTTERLRVYIEETEAKLLLIAGRGRRSKALE